MIRWILFDAVGTLVDPSPPVADAYWSAGNRHGSQLLRDEIQQRFSHAFAISEEPGLHAWRTNEESERRRWQMIVNTIFDDVADGVPLFEDLWDHFAQPKHWRLFDDVADVLPRLVEAGYKLGLASNFDARLWQLHASFPPLQLCTSVFVSSELGHRKPSPEFFRTIEGELKARPEEILLVGDSIENDYRPAIAAGWQALLVDRDVPSVPTAGARGNAEADRLTTLSELPARLAALSQETPAEGRHVPRQPR